MPRITRAGDADPGSRKGGEEERVALLIVRIAQACEEIIAVTVRKPYDLPTRRVFNLLLIASTGLARN
jgi:hypothetical protein